MKDWTSSRGVWRMAAISTVTGGVVQQGYLGAAGDVCGSIEEKDAKQYGMGFDAALTYGHIMGETLKKEI